MKRSIASKRVLRRIPKQLRAFKLSKLVVGVSSAALLLVVIAVNAISTDYKTSKSGDSNNENSNAKTMSASNKLAAAAPQITDRDAGNSTPTGDSSPSASTQIGGTAAKPGSKPTGPGATKVTISLSQTSVSLAAGGASGTITASTSPTTPGFWSVTSSNAGVRAGQPIGTQPNGMSTSFAIYTDANVAPGNYQVTASVRTTATQLTPSVTLYAVVNVTITPRPTYLLNLLDTDATVNDSGMVSLPFTITRQGGHSKMLYPTVSFNGGPDPSNLMYSAGMSTNDSGAVYITVNPSAIPGDYYFVLNVADNFGQLQQEEFAIQVE